MGTRPEAIKLAPVVSAIEAVTGLEPVVILTAQHREMLDSVLRVFNLTPDLDLNIFAPGQSLEEVTTRALSGMAAAIAKTAPDLVVVQGDTTTTFTAALAAFYARIPVAHVEAGLRSGDAANPFPEEINRRLTSHIAAMHFSPTQGARENLLREGIKAQDIFVTGNTVIDALLWAAERVPPPLDPVLTRLLDDPRRMLLVTAHRRESWGEEMRSIGRALATLAKRHPDLSIVFPIHANPAVRAAITPAISGLGNVTMLEPLPYGDFVHLLRRAHIVLTDSGGIQEEAPALGKPVLVMRGVTERPEAVAFGTAMLVGTKEGTIVAAVSDLLVEEVHYERMARATNPYGDGRAAVRIAGMIARAFGLTDARIDEFVAKPAGGRVEEPASAYSVAEMSTGAD